MSEVTRTVVVKSAPLPRRVFRVFAELEGMYRSMVEQLALFTVRNNLASFTRLKALKYRELRVLYRSPPTVSLGLRRSVHRGFWARPSHPLRASAPLRRGTAQSGWSRRHPSSLPCDSIIQSGL